jgi:hypothetical protein
MKDCHGAEPIKDRQNSRNTPPANPVKPAFFSANGQNLVANVDAMHRKRFCNMPTLMTLSTLRIGPALIRLTGVANGRHGNDQQRRLPRRPSRQR